VAWSGVDTGALVQAGVPFRPLEAVIGETGLAAAASAARQWARLWGRLPLLDGRSFRDLVQWHETSLLWLAEAFIQRQTTGPRCARLAEMALRLLEATRAEEVDATGLGPVEAALLSRACTVSGVLFHGPSRSGRAPHWRARGRRHVVDRFLAPRNPPPLPPALTCGAATPERDLLVVAGPDVDIEALRPLLEAVSAELGWSTIVVRVTELEGRATRRARRAAREAEARLRDCRERLRDGPGLHQSYSHRGVGFPDLAATDIDRILLGQLPTAVRRLEAAVELFGTLEGSMPVLLAGCGRDDRRALAWACSRAGVAAAALHTAPPGPDDVERDDGGPRADVHLVWEPGTGPDPVLVRLRAIVKRE
jgi:hypothetical protein